jgi:hypothetical protein
MKSFVRALLFVALLATTVSAIKGSPDSTPTAIVDPAAPVFRNLQNDPLFDQRTYEKLREIPVDISLNNVDLRTALRDLTLLALRSDPEREELIFRFSTAATPEERQRKVSIVVRQASVFSVLEYLGEQASFQIRVHRNIVLIEPVPVAGTVP